MIDFPASPTVGQVFNSGIGAIYIWDGVAWSVVTNQLLTALNKNLIVNPSMQISQESGNSTISANGYVVDQWILGSSGLSQSAARSLGYASPNNSPATFVTSFSVAKASLAAGDYGSVYQPIEGQFCAELGWGTTRAIPAVLRFNAACQTAGTYTVALFSGGTDYSWLGAFTCDGTTTLKTFVFPIPAQVAGTFAKDNTVGLYLRFTYAVGTQYGGGVAGWQSGYKFGIAGMTNGAAIISKDLVVADVGLYPDPNNTGLPPLFAAPNYADELARCQRYWHQLDMFLINASYGNASGQMLCSIPYAPGMRLVPTVTYLSPSYSNSSNIRNNAVGTWNLRAEATQTAAGAAWANATVVMNARM